MGINGLPDIIEPYFRKTQITEFAGKGVSVGCTNAGGKRSNMNIGNFFFYWKLYFFIDIDRSIFFFNSYIDFNYTDFIQYLVNTLKGQRIDPYLVFDGNVPRIKYEYKRHRYNFALNYVYSTFY